MPGFRFSLREAGGAFGDLGTFLPHVLSVLTVGGLASGGVLFGFGLFYLVTGLVYRLPVPVQPMKAVSAVIVTAGLTPGAVAATGLILGVVLLVLGLSGAIDRLARAVPASVIAGLRLGIGLGFAWFGLTLIGGAPWLGAAILALLIGLTLVPGCPATLIGLAVALVVGQVGGFAPPLATLAPGFALPGVVWPSLAEMGAALHSAVLPQIALTITNAVIITAALARGLYPEGGTRVSERRLCLTSGAANLLLAPFGALPMCHGAGGLQAHHRFGARSGAAPLLLGGLCLALALFFSEAALGLLAMIPLPAVGAFLVLAGAELAISRRLFDARPDCWPAIALTTLGTVVFDAAIGLVVGCTIEAGRSLARDLFRNRRSSRK
ncbi:MAG: putative sulfate/molybdate transporter [Kiloniellaceae bacterium]